MEWVDIKRLLDASVRKEKEDGHNNRSYTNRIGKSVSMAACLAESAIEDTWAVAERNRTLRPVQFALSQLMSKLDSFDIEDDGYAVSTVGSILTYVRKLREELGDTDSEGQFAGLEGTELRTRLTEIVSDKCRGGLNEEHMRAITAAIPIATEAIERSFDLAISHQTLLPILLSIAKARAQFEGPSDSELDQYPREVLAWILRAVADLQRELGEHQKCTYEELLSLKWPSDKIIDYRGAIDSNMEEIVRTIQYYGASDIRLVWVSEASQVADETFLAVPDQAKILAPKAKFTATGVPSVGRQELCIGSVAFVLKFPVNIEFLPADEVKKPA